MHLFRLPRGTSHVQLLATLAVVIGLIVTLELSRTTATSEEPPEEVTTVPLTPQVAQAEEDRAADLARAEALIVGHRVQAVIDPPGPVPPDSLILRLENGVVLNLIDYVVIPAESVWISSGPTEDPR